MIRKLLFQRIRAGMARKMVNLGLCAVVPAAAAGRESDASPVREAAVHDVVIVGGGIAGLAAGYYLRDRNLVLLEKNDVVGRRTASGRYRSFTCARGTEYPGKPDVVLACMVRERGLTLKALPSPMDVWPQRQHITLR